MAEEKIEVGESVEAVLARLDERTKQMQEHSTLRFDALEKRFDGLNTNSAKYGGATGAIGAAIVVALKHFIGGSQA